MKSLSYEILSEIFQHLDLEDRFECLLTCKEWHSVAERILYADIAIIHEESAKLLVRTLTTSPQLGKHVKKIDVFDLLENEDKLWLWNEQNLLNVIAERCPNLLKIESYSHDISFWSQISYASMKGQLSQLQSLPHPNSDSLEQYLFTILLLKDSLTAIYVTDNEGSFGVNLKDLAVYKKIKDQMNEFKHLQDFSLTCLSNNQLSDFDTMIDSLPRLKKLSFDLTLTKKQSETTKDKLLACRPRPDIDELTCNWNMINHQNQLEFVMEKFQNLKSLTVGHSLFKDSKFGVTASISFKTVMEFIRFVVLKLPSYYVSLEIDGDDLGEIWSELINMKDTYRDVNICYFYKKDSEDIVLLSLSPINPIIYIPFDDEDEDLTSLDFLSKSESMIRSVKLHCVHEKNVGIVPANLIKFIETLSDMESVSRILRLCPELQELVLPALEYKIPSNYLGFRHTEVKKLTINDIPDNPVCLKSLEYFSLNLPSLKHLELHYENDVDDEDALKHLTIYMPNTWLDQLTSFNLSYRRSIRKRSEAHIKLRTDAGLNYYIGNKNGLLKISEELYKALPPKCFSFDITCRALKEIVISKKYSSVDDIKWVF